MKRGWDSALRARAVIVLAIVGFGAGCAGGVPMQSTVATSPGAASEMSPDSARPSTYRVGAGDTIYVVARRFGISVRALIDVNGMQPPFQINPGQVLKLPSGGGYVVQKGDTLSRVARKTGTQFSTLARINGLTSPYVIRVGQRLQLPDMTPSSTPEETVIESPKDAKQAPAPKEVAAVAVQPVPEVRPIPAASPSMAMSGSASYRPLAERDPPPKPEVIATSPAAAAPRTPSPTLAPPLPEPAPIPQNVAMVVPPQTSVPSESPVSGSGFVWPVSGEVIAGFGTYGKEQHNDGINIKVPMDTPVKAAADGTVVYVGNELRGFGNLLLIKHANGWMSAYAHNDALLVKKGDIVKRGQVIARSGDSGGVSPPQLHFELRRGVRPVDPATELPDAPRS